MVDRLALSQCLGAEDDGLAGALQAFFAPAEGDAPLLSDLMDQLDVAEVRYTYLAWTGEGDAVLRPGNAS